MEINKATLSATLQQKLHENSKVSHAVSYFAAEIMEKFKDVTLCYFAAEIKEKSMKISATLQQKSHGYLQRYNAVSYFAAEIT